MTARDEQEFDQFPKEKQPTTQVGAFVGPKWSG